MSNMESCNPHLFWSGLAKATMGLLNAAASGNGEVRGEALELAAEGGYAILVK